MDFFSKIISLLKSPLRSIILLSTVMGLLLFLPQEWIVKLKLSKFIEEYGKYIGIVFIFSIGYILISFFPYLYKVVRNKQKFKKLKTTILDDLEKLKYPEKCFLREFVLQGKDVIEAPIECTELTSLYNKGIILFASKNTRNFVFGTFTSILINPLIKDELNYQHFGLPRFDKAIPEEIEKVKSERPDFLISLESINNLMNKRKWA